MANFFCQALWVKMAHQAYLSQLKTKVTTCSFCRLQAYHAKRMIYEFDVFRVPPLLKIKGHDASCTVSRLQRWHANILVTLE